MAESAAQDIDLAEVIDRAPIGPVQILVTALCAAVLFVDGYDIQVMALTVPSLTQEWGLPASSFGWALSAVVIGITLGSAIAGPFGDRLGRKTMLAGSMIAIGIGTACTALATTPGEFVFWRLVTGLALGAGIPSCAALNSEYAPVAQRSLMMGFMNVASPIGAFAAGFIAPPVLEAFGWKGAFVIGGAAPQLLAVVIILVAPESLKFLTVRRPADPSLARILRRIAPGVDPARVRPPSPEEVLKPSPLELLGPALRARTLLLWGLLALNLFNLYVLISWLPTLLSDAGWASGDALRGAVLIQGGGVVGGLFLSTFLDRGATRTALVTGFCVSAACLLLFMALPSGPAWVALLLFLGAGVSGAQLCLNALSAAYYPPAIKATGVAWALVIGSIGSVLAPLAGAWFIELKLEPVEILGLLAIPALICAAGVAVMRREWQAH